MTQQTAEIWFAHALLPDGWHQGVTLSLLGAHIAKVATQTRPSPQAERHFVGLPGLPNLHSHAFQRAMAGLAEAPGASSKGDDFWSWRELMYALTDRLTPEDCATIAAMAYVEMLETGFTRVGEFHYLHHDRGGTPYAGPAMAEAIGEAAAASGIGLTLLPVFYAHSGFGGQEPLPHQRRFLHDLDGFARLLDSCAKSLSCLPGFRLGLAPHSLRAVTGEELSALSTMLPGAPVHIHVAEQTAEVDACLAATGMRPVEWLMENAPVGENWCLVHATHVKEHEWRAIVQRRAVVGLCPVTEANLGDGLFPAHDFAAAGGLYGVGSDSNVRIDAAEELRLLEYGQRLQSRGRNLMAAKGCSTGRSLFEAAYRGGSQALGVAGPGLQVGDPADFVSLKADELIDARGGDALLDQWIFARGCVDSVWRAGRRLVTNGSHYRRADIATRFAALQRRLFD